MKDELMILQVGQLVEKGKFANPQRGRVYSQHWGGSTMTSIIEITNDNNMAKKFTQEKNNNQQFNLPKELKGKKFRIRKLTPRECFRLMDVDDVDIDKIQDTGIANTNQYKLAGNSIVVNVLYHIFRKMFIETEIDKKDNEPTQLTLF